MCKKGAKNYVAKKVENKKMVVVSQGGKMQKKKYRGEECLPPVVCSTL